MHKLSTKDRSLEPAMTAQPHDNLAVREMILGVLKSLDRSGASIIHSSDFRSAITELGFPMGSPVVENILVHCKIDNKGNLNFSDLEKELVRVRRIMSSKTTIDKAPVSTSTGAVSKPWRGDEFHKSKLEAERQLLKVTEHNTRINEIFSLLSHHKVSPAQALNDLSALDIQPTKEFIKLLQVMTFNEVSFSQFVKALTSGNSNGRDLEDQNMLAGDFRKSCDNEIGLQHKRTSRGMQTAFHESANMEIKQRSIRKMISSPRSSDAIIYKTQQLKDTLFTDRDPVSLLSHNQQAMVGGTLGQSDIDISFNVEAKLQREQVLAALRKLDIGEISMDDFQDMLFSIGVDLPETLAVDIRRAVDSGRMDVKKYVKLMDASIFKNGAIEQRISETDISMLKDRFQAAAVEQGLDALLDLSRIFHELDRDKNGSLTFSEFRLGCEALKLDKQLNDNELRLLFHSFDRNGDGSLQFEEFLDSVRGPLPATRALWVRRAFQRVDVHGCGCVSIDALARAFHAEGHPNVCNGLKSAREVASEFVRFFTSDPSFSGEVEYPRFQKYFSNISSNLSSDEEFESLLKSCWNMTDSAPAPPVYKLKHTAGLASDEFEIPQAIQSHGDCITWGQEQSLLEKQARELEAKKGKRREYAIRSSPDRNGTDIVNWTNRNENLTATRQLDNEMRHMGVSRISSGYKNFSSSSLLSWVTNDQLKKLRADEASTPAAGSSNTDVNVFKSAYQDEYKPAGVTTVHMAAKSTQDVPPPVGVYVKSVPFGVDPVPPPSPKRDSSQVKSLADVIREKNTVKSLHNQL